MKANTTTATSYAQSSLDTSYYKSAIEEARAKLYHRFNPKRSVKSNLVQYSNFIVRMLRDIWLKCGFPAAGNEIVLICTGSLGRKQLQPYSDIDLLILYRPGTGHRYHARIERFIASLWEIKLNLGHSVRDLDECLALAAKDITVITNLIEAQPVAGSDSLFWELNDSIGPEKMWNNIEFFQAKLEEWQQRRRQFADATWNLEPDIKNSPGGLRELQTLSWMTQRYYGDNNLKTNIQRGLLTEKEWAALNRGLSFLWRVRFALHMLCERCQDRMRLDLQPEIAQLMGYQNDRINLAVEQFMKRYYQQVMENSMLCQLLVDNFREQVLEAGTPAVTTRIDEHFSLKNNYLELNNPKIFARYPSTLLRIFTVLAQNPEIQGIRPETIRHLRDNLHLIKSNFRSNAENAQLFISLLRSPYKVARQLDSMWRYGVLGAWLPEFGRIHGLMQFDLFHIYTVDAHIIRVVINLRKFRVGKQTGQFKLASEVMRHLPKPELLYIAALYHDIAKGRGGDHSVLGARDVRNFCRRHNLTPGDTEIICWLVANHLAMSITAQKRDLSDPAVITEFATMTGDVARLDYLYVLTVADITATNPALWNAWRARLLEDLYLLTRRRLLCGNDNTINTRTTLVKVKREAMEILIHQHPRAAILKLWRRLGKEYFLRERPRDIAWHSAGILSAPDADGPVVIADNRDNPAFDSAFKVFIYCRHQTYLFSNVTSVLEKLNLSIRDAHLATTKDGYTLNTFFIQGAKTTTAENLEITCNALRKQLQKSSHPPQPTNKLMPTRLRNFKVPLEISFTHHDGQNYTQMEVLTADRPALLGHLVQALERFPITLYGARITTLGERVNDIFYLRDQVSNRPLKGELCEQIKQAIFAMIVYLYQNRDDDEKS